MYIVSVVDMKIQGAASREVLLVGPVAHTVARPTGPAKEGEAEQSTTAFALHIFFERLILRPETNAMADLHCHSGAPGLTRKLPGFLGGGREGFLAKHMFSGAKRTLNVLRVMQGGNTDIHHVDTIGPERLVEIIIDGYVETEFLCL